MKAVLRVASLVYQVEDVLVVWRGSLRSITARSLLLIALVHAYEVLLILSWLPLRQVEATDAPHVLNVVIWLVLLSTGLASTDLAR